MARLIFSLFLMPVLLLETSVFSSAHATPWLIVNALAYPPIIAASIALHEAGHAAVARLLGLRVPAVHLGFGRRIARWRWGAMRIQVNAFPYLGFTFLGADHLRRVRTRLWLVTLAGPLVTLAIVWLALVLGELCMRDVVWPCGAMIAGPAPSFIIGFANLWLLVWNVVPLRFTGVSAGNDGMSLFRLPFTSDDVLRDLLVMPAVLEAAEQLEDGDLDATQRALADGLALAPRSWALRNVTALLQQRRGELREARAATAALIAELPPNTGYEWPLRNNLAWADFRIRDPDLLAEADQHSAAVHQRFRHVGWALGTRGAVLGWLGRHDEAIDLLEQAFLRNPAPVNRALNAACLAISCAALGRTDEAKRWLRRAEALDTACPLLAEATAAVAGGRKASG